MITIVYVICREQQAASSNPQRALARTRGGITLLHNTALHFTAHAASVGVVNHAVSSTLTPEYLAVSVAAGA